MIGRFDGGIVMRLRRGLWAAAVVVCQSVGAADVPVMNPDGDGRLQMARQAIADGAWRRAVLELQLVLQERAQDPDVHNLLGYALRKLDPPRLDLALYHYRTALAIDPHHLGAHEYIGEAYLMLGDLQQARFHLDQLQRICGSPSCEPYQDLAEALARAQASRDR